MLGLVIEGEPLLRAYSIVSPNHAEYLEFLSIKVQDGPLTSVLQHIKTGDQVLIGGKPVGTLTIDDLRVGKRLMIFASGTGLAPFMAIIRDPETYEKFEYVELHHSVRKSSDAAYREYLTRDMRETEMGEFIGNRLFYKLNVTRGKGRSLRLTTQIDAGYIELEDDDRAMVCGSQGFLTEMGIALECQGLQVSPAAGQLGDFVIERAFVS